MNTSKKDTLKKILNLAIELNYIAEVEMSNDSWQTEEDEEISEEIGKLYDAIVSASNNIETAVGEFKKATNIK